MIYTFAVFSDTSPIFTGTVDSPTLDQAITKAAHEGARRAYVKGHPWDPFNLWIVMKAKPKRKQRRATHK